MWKKLREWGGRYLPAEVFATIGALLGAGVTYYLTDNRFFSAYVGTMGENIGYYGFIIIRDFVISFQNHKQNGVKFGFRSFVKNIRNLILEFGFSETLDSMIVRPFCMYVVPLFVGNYVIGVFIGKIIADIIFYIPTIIAYELKKEYLIDEIDSDSNTNSM